MYFAQCGVRLDPSIERALYTNLELEGVTPAFQNETLCTRLNSHAYVFMVHANADALFALLGVWREPNDSANSARVKSQLLVTYVPASSSFSSHALGACVLARERETRAKANANGKNPKSIVTNVNSGISVARLLPKSNV
jgi:hypothetical protein